MTALQKIVGAIICFSISLIFGILYSEGVGKAYLTLLIMLTGNILGFGLLFHALLGKN